MLYLKVTPILQNQLMEPIF